jgi:tungstate transport system permease protein
MSTRHVTKPSSCRDREAQYHDKHIPIVSGQRQEFYIILVPLQTYMSRSMISELTEIILLSLQVSGTALLFSTLIGVPIGALIGLTRFIGRRFVTALLYTGMGFPPVVVGLFVYLMLSRSGPLGRLSLSFSPQLFTPGAMVLAQTIIAFPLVAGFTMVAVMSIDPQLRLQVAALGATRHQVVLTILAEARLGVLV